MLTFWFWIATALPGYFFLKFDLHIFYVIWILLFAAAMLAEKDRPALRSALVLNLIVGAIWLAEILVPLTQDSLSGLALTMTLQYLAVAAVMTCVLLAFMRRHSLKS